MSQNTLHRSGRVDLRSARVDLQIERNLERFFQLSGISPQQIAARMVFQQPPFKLCLEIHIEKLLMTTVYHDPLLAPAMWWYLLHCCHPGATFGVVQRPFLIAEEVWLNCTLPSATQADTWYRLYGIQHHLLLQAVQRANT